MQRYGKKTTVQNLALFLSSAVKAGRLSIPIMPFIVDIAAFGAFGRVIFPTRIRVSFDFDLEFAAA
jgi:hypothetical protein